ncbi:MAG: TonB-dependent receptor [Ferruginibacter sp.]|nr:TonB-dependent receptor [Ferruginibacter sp.]
MKYFLSFGLLCNCLIGFGQTKIAGRLTDTKNKSLRGASITIRNSYDGTTTDSLGNFLFTTNETGDQLLEANISGYSSYSKNIKLEGKEILLNISIKELITELKAVVITAGAFEASDAKKATVLTSIDIVTTASAEGDITGALKTLPGTQQVGETGGLFVRGGTATESKIFIDGNLVNNFFYSSVPGIASRGRFNPFLFKGTVFSSGGYSALYGQALSSALILESTDLPDKTSANIALSIIGAGAGIEKLAKNKKSSWGLTYNYTNLWLAFNVIKQRRDFYAIPVDQQVDGNFRIKTKGGIVKYYGYVNWSNVGFRTQDIDSLRLKDAFSLKNLNIYHNLNWKEKIGKGWRVNAGLSYSTNMDQIKTELQNNENVKLELANDSLFSAKNADILNKGQYAQARLVLEKRLKGLNAIRLGADHFYSKEEYNYTGLGGFKFTGNVKENLTAAFAETDFYISNNIAAKLGTRLEYSRIMARWNIAPRASVAYKFKDNSQASFAYGLFYQTPESKYLPPLANNLGYAKAAHYILQYQRTSSLRTFRTEVFYKKYDNLFKTAGFREQALNNNGYGYARGIEIFWRDKKSIKNLDYWISYSYLDTKRDFLNFPSEMQPSFAATHTASLVMKKFVVKWKTGFNASYTFATGRPYYQIRKDASQNNYIYDKGRTINYNGLGFSLNYLPNLGKTKAKAFTVLVLSVSNVLGQKQIYGYNYAAVADRKLPILPPSKRFVYIGCFISIGIDRTQDAINNNL